LVSFSFNAGETEEVTISANSSYTKSFAGKIKEVRVYIKQDDGSYL